mmetsp:Transcript_15924/g.47926  ORF Transcript_15924/g.47926 Transcript_15924/m.47926 type:complete len:212 (+) Transcript_15924:156-791(+)
MLCARAGRWPGCGGGEVVRRGLRCLLRALPGDRDSAPLLVKALSTFSMLVKALSRFSVLAKALEPEHPLDGHVFQRFSLPSCLRQMRLLAAETAGWKVHSLASFSLVVFATARSLSFPGLVSASLLRAAHLGSSPPASPLPICFDFSSILGLNVCSGVRKGSAFEAGRGESSRARDAGSGSPLPCCALGRGDEPWRGLSEREGSGPPKSRA